MAEEPIKVSCLGVGCCSNILSRQGQPTPSWELPRGSYSLKGQWKEEGRHTIFIYSNKHHGQSESDGDDWSVGTEWGALSQGWPWQTPLKPGATTTLRLHGTHSEGSEKGLLNCSRL